jgi:hypothetical protein
MGSCKNPAPGTSASRARAPHHLIHFLVFDPSSHVDAQEMSYRIKTSHCYLYRCKTVNDRISGIFGVAGWTATVQKTLII